MRLQAYLKKFFLWIGIGILLLAGACKAQQAKKASENAENKPLRSAEQTKKQENCSLNGTIKSLKGLDGCSFVIEIDESGKRLEPFFREGFDMSQLKDGRRVSFSYEVKQAMSICMAGQPADIVCIVFLD